MQTEFTAWSTNRSVRSKDERFVPQPNGLGEPIHLELSLVEAGRGDRIIFGTLTAHVRRASFPRLEARLIARSCSLATAERFLHHDTAVSNLPTYVTFAGMLPAVISGASSAPASAPRTFVTLGLLNRNSGANAAPLAQLACAIPLCRLGEIELDASFLVHGDYGIAYWFYKDSLQGTAGNGPAGGSSLR